MCDITLALAIGATVATAGSAIYSANAKAESDRYNQQVANMNAELSERRARDALDRGREEEQQARLKAAQIQGAQVAAMAANGVDLGFGSPLDTLVDTATMGELDALTIRRNAASEAYDYRVQAASGRADAAMDGASANSAMTGGYLDAFSTILGGGSRAYSSWQESNIKVPLN